MKHSWTVWSMTFTGICSLILENIDLITGDNFKQQIVEAGFDPLTAGRVGLIISIIALIARLRKK